MGKIQLVYWDLRGFAEAARMMLEYGGLEYENVLYENGGPPDFDNSCWFDVKFKLGLDFPNLPYLVDGDIKFSESWAIYKYIGKKIGLVPKTDKEEYECDMVAGVLQGIRQAFGALCYNPDFENLKEGVRKSQTEKLQLFDKFLAGKQYLLGDRMTYVDFVCFETFDHHRLLFPGILDPFPNVSSFMKSFESLGKITDYFSSGRYHRFPINGKRAQWGGNKQ